jgi:hypothetical protein
MAAVAASNPAVPSSSSASVVKPAKSHTANSSQSNVPSST